MRKLMRECGDLLFAPRIGDIRHRRRAQPPQGKGTRADSRDAHDAGGQVGTPCLPPREQRTKCGRCGTAHAFELRAAIEFVGL
jgi:hypothetical protein